MPKKKILHIIKSLGRGGAEMLLPETLRLHDTQEFEFHYIYFLPWKDQMVKAIEDAGGKVTCFAANNNLQILRKYNQVIQYCQVQNIDVIHCHLPWSGFLGRIVFWKSGIPMVYTEHNIQERYHILTKNLNKLSFNRQSIALGVSNDVTRSINQNIKPSIPVKTLLNGVNTEKFKRDSLKGIAIRKEYGIPQDALVVGNVAVFREQKNIPGWIEAFKIIADKQEDVYGLLVGEGPERERIEKMIARFGLSEKILLAGLQADTVAYFSAMDIFMMSSAFEGLPVALLEAMSMECAVVSTKAGGVTEAIRNDKDGLLCEIGDSKCLAQQTESLVRDENKRQLFQSSARNRVENEFSLSAMVQTLEKIYLKF